MPENSDPALDKETASTFANADPNKRDAGKAEDAQGWPPTLADFEAVVAERDRFATALEEIDRACSHDLLRLTGKALSDMRPEDRTRSLQAITRRALNGSSLKGGDAEANSSR